MSEKPTIHKIFSSDVTVSDGERSVAAYISTAAVDRDGEVLLPQGMNAKDYLANPVVFLNHSYWTLPVGKCTGIKRDETGITAKTTFAERPKSHPEGEEWVPDTLFSLFQQGVLKGFSVGFLPIESRPASEKDVKDFGPDVQRVFSKWKLLEYSVAPLPCNQDAVATAVSKGLIRAETAEKLFGKGVETPKNDEKPAENEQKDAGGANASAPTMAQCKTCGKEFNVADMEMMDDPGDGTAPAYQCKECAGKGAESAAGDPPASDSPMPANVAPQKHVVRTVESEEEEKPIAVKRVHRILEAEPVKKSPVKKLVIAEVRKRQGHLY